MTETVPCDACFGTGIEPPLNDLDGKVMNPNAVCLSCQGQAHVRAEVPTFRNVVDDGPREPGTFDHVEWVHPEPSDADRWRFFASSPQTALMLGSRLDPNDATVDWTKECNRLADTAMRETK